MDVVGLYNTTSTFAQSGTDYLQHASHALLAGVDVLLATLHAALSMLGDPWVLEPFRYLLFSAIFEAVRRSWYTLQTKIVQSLFVEVRVDNGDFVWDWLDDYLTAHNVWGHATSYRLVSVPAAGRHPGSQRAAKEHTADDSGHPFPVYQSTPEQAEFWKWRGWWIKVFKQPGVYDYKTGTWASRRSRCAADGACRRGSRRVDYPLVRHPLANYPVSLSDVPLTASTHGTDG